MEQRATVICKICKFNSGKDHPKHSKGFALDKMSTRRRNQGLPVSNCDPRDKERQTREILEMIEEGKWRRRVEMREREKELAKSLGEMPRIVRDHARAKKKLTEMAAGLQLCDDCQGEGGSSDSGCRSTSAMSEAEGLQFAAGGKKIREMQADRKSLSTGNVDVEKSRSRLHAAWSIITRGKGGKSTTSLDHVTADVNALGISGSSGSSAETQPPAERDHDHDIASVGALRRQRLIKSRKLSSRLKRGFEVIFGLDKPEPLKEKLSIWLGENYKDKGTLRESLDFSDSESEEPTDHEEEEKEEGKEEKEVVEANGAEEVKDEDEFIYWRPAPVSQPLKPV